MTLTQDRKGEIKDRVVYDPVIRGYDQSFFKSVSGTPSVSSNKIRLNQAKIASYPQFLYGDFRFKITIPTTPSTGESKEWGLQLPSTTQGAMFFDIAGATFSFKSYDTDNNATSTTVTWDQKGQTWEAVAITYRILWTEKEIKAYISDGTAEILVATHESGDNNLPLPLYIDNLNDSDNVDITNIIANKVAKIIT